ncbi:hypothetical protein SEUCBS140593_004943 [Sporothrix eucalyptigena]|uniref:SMP-30/Gluconolactonase/LRE-like region domain-containing protein n=1 Tax=Sporothrix eucalyptigena TaxID=1812306 RepID=A0ABP0BTV7_9PEZI
MSTKLQLVTAALLLFTWTGQCTNSASSTAATAPIASLPATYQYLLEAPFSSDITKDFVDSTTTGNGTVNNALKSAQQAAAISYDAEFDAILGASPSIRTVATLDGPNAYEMGAWMYDRNELWFTSSVISGSTNVYKMDLTSFNVTKLELPPPSNLPAFQPTNYNGGIYHNGSVYVTLSGTNNGSSGILRIDPATLENEVVLNSYFGLELPSVDDVSIVYARSTRETHVFFTTLNIHGWTNATGTRNISVPDAIWRFTLETQTLRPVLTRSDNQNPNGVAIDVANQIIYFTETPYPGETGTGVGTNPASAGISVIYQYDLAASSGFVPTSKRTFGFARSGAADGTKVDDYGRLWTGEYEGIVVRNTAGKVIGLFNKEYILGTQSPEIELANFALAGDKLYILAVDKIVEIDLAQTVWTPKAYLEI